MAGINIPFLSNVRDFLKGTGQVEDALDDVIDSLDNVGSAGDDVGRSGARGLEDMSDAARDAGRAMGDVGDDARDAGRDIERGLGNATDDATDDAEKLERSFRDAFDAVRDGSRDAGKAVASDVGDGASEASEGMEDLKDEAKGTSAEVAASFDGSLDSIAGGFQELAANAFAGFGPAGAIAGMAAAAGIGMAMSALQGAADEANAYKDKIIELADALSEVNGDVSALEWGQIFKDFGNEIADAKSWFEPWQEANKTNYEEVKEMAEKSGVAYADLFQGMAGNSEAAQRAMGDLNSKIEEQKSVLESLTPIYSENGVQMDATYRAEEDRLAQLNDVHDKLEEGAGLTEDAIEHEKLMEESIQGSAAALEKKNDAQREQLELTGQAIASELDYLDAIESGTAALAENTAAGFDKNTAAGRENLRTLSQMAGATTDYADALAEQTGDQLAANAAITDGRAKVLAAAQSLGMSEQAANSYADSLGLIPREVSTTAQANTDAANRALRDLTAARDVPVGVAVNHGDWQNTVDSAARSLRPPTIQINAAPGTMRAV